MLGIGMQSHILSVASQPRGPQGSFSTIAHSVQDYSERTFAAADAPPPPEPMHMMPLCHHWVGGAAPDFELLPTRQMHWAPTAVHEHAPNGSRRICDWTPSWICHTCSVTVSPEALHTPGGQELCVQCGHGQRWVFDLHSGHGAWRCLRCDAGAALTRVAEQEEPQGTRLQLLLGSGLPEPVRFRSYWPPAGPIHADMNSFLYVPVLLNASGMLHEDIAQSWQRHELAASWWQQAADVLTTARGRCALMTCTRRFA